MQTIINKWKNKFRVNTCGAVFPEKQNRIYSFTNYYNIIKYK
jgi:hypothetical protein